MTLSDNNPSVLTVNNLSVSYAGTNALSITNLSVLKGEFIAILGPNGAGKSTLIKSILGLISFQGKISFAVDKKKIVYLPQQQAIDWDFPISVLQAVSLSRLNQKTNNTSSLNNKEIIQNALKKVGIAELAHKSIKSLSGGQRQRLLLARILVREADLFLLDEPFTGLDSFWQEKVYAILQEKQNENKIILLVTHDLAMAKHFSSRLVFLNQGRIVADHANSPIQQSKLNDKTPLVS